MSLPPHEATWFCEICCKSLEPINQPESYTIIRFVRVRAKFVICTVVSVNGTLVEDKMRIFKGESAKFIFNKCPIYTRDGASAKFSTSSHEMDNSVRYSILSQLWLQMETPLCQAGPAPCQAGPQQCCTVEMEKVCQQVPSRVSFAPLPTMEVWRVSSLKHKLIKKNRTESNCHV